ncbi:MAG: hypothetical protein KDC12_10470 [Flavobacteriales bacterium]|nr:hypothetical protein [Flavobacteriales bacterium]
MHRNNHFGVGFAPLVRLTGTNRISMIPQLFKVIVFLSFVIPSFSLFAQRDTTVIQVQGIARDERGFTKPDLLIVNQRTRLGNFGGADGKYNVTCNKSDTLVFGAMGYNSVKVCFADSVLAGPYTFDLRLYPITISIGAAEVIAPRDLEKIQSDIKKLGYNEDDFKVSGIDAAASPITFLYQSFSKRERSKRLAYEMFNDDRRRELLKELFVKYVDYEIIDLEEVEFDGFIDFIGVSDSFLKHTSQYDFIIFVKKRYADYKVYRRSKPLEESEFYYHED